MRLLHTSDWHLGQTFFGESRAAEHAVFLRTLVSLCEHERPDVLLLCGDVFDTINPNAEAEEQWYGFLADLSERAPQVRLQVIAGNHDSPARLCAPSALVSRMSKDNMEIHARAAFVSDVGNTATTGSMGHSGDLNSQPHGTNSVQAHKRLDPHVHLRRVRGASGVEACLALVPFLRPSDIPAAYGVEGTKPLHDFLTSVYLQLANDAKALFPGLPLIFTGHLFAAGGLASEHSERKIQRGNLEALPVETLEAHCSYFALGHLHRAQALGAAKRVRYSGSPLPLSFTETDYEHQVLCVDVAADGSTVVTPRLLPRARRFVRLPRQHAPPREVLAACDTLDVAQGELAPFVEVRVALDAPQPGLRREVEQRLAARGARLIQYSVLRAAQNTLEGQNNATHNGEREPRDRPTSLSDFSALDIFERCYMADFGTAPSEALRATFLECVEAASASETNAASGDPPR